MLVLKAYGRGKSGCDLMVLYVVVCRLVKRCRKPDRKEFWTVAQKTAIGFLAVGLIGFFVKLIFIPINQV